MQPIARTARTALRLPAQPFPAALRTPFLEAAARRPEPLEHVVLVAGVLERTDADGSATQGFDVTAIVSEADQDIALTLVRLDGTEIDVVGTLQRDGVVTVTITLETDGGEDTRAWTTVVPLADSDRFSLLLDHREGFAGAHGSIEHSAALPATGSEDP